MSSSARPSSLTTGISECANGAMNQVSPTAVISAPVRLAGSWPQIASPPYRYVRPIAQIQQGGARWLATLEAERLGGERQDRPQSPDGDAEAAAPHRATVTHGDRVGSRADP